MLGKASKSENLLKNRSAVGCCGFFARNGGGADAVGGCGLGNVADCGYCGREAVEHFFNFRDLVLLSGERGPDSEPGVEHFFNF